MRVVDGEERILVKFIRQTVPYNVGEQAGFAVNMAHILVRRGFAEYVDPKDDPDCAASEPDDEAAAGPDDRAVLPLIEEAEEKKSPKGRRR